MKYFKTDGIRGILGEDLSYSLIIKIANSLSLFKINKVYIGYDTRCTASVIKKLLALGINKNIEVFDIGIAPTPAIMYLSKLTNSIGIAITASHNPYYYNGIKLIIRGMKPNNEQINKITNYIDNNKPIIYYNDLISYDFEKTYVNYLSNYKTKSNLKAIIDSANGALYKITKYIFDDVFDSVKYINCTPNGININDRCGAVALDNLKQSVKNLDYDIGIAFDGDGDRIIIVDKYGNTLNGDIIALILAKYFKSMNCIDSVCLTIMADLGIIKEFKKLGIRVYQSDVGDTFLLNTMLDNNIILGSEASGHIIPLLYTNIGDGILNALLFIKAINTLNIDVNEIYNSTESFYTKTINIPIFSGYDLNMFSDIENKYLKIYHDDFKLIFRKSGTEKLLRLTISIGDKNVLENVIEECLNKIKIAI